MSFIATLCAWGTAVAAVLFSGWMVMQLFKSN